MKIGVDASRYKNSGATGVEWYSFHIINELKKRSDDLIFYSAEKLELPNNKVLPVKRLWTLWALTREMQQNPPDVLFVPSHVLPLKLPIRSVITIHDVAFRHLRSSYSFFQYHYLNWSTKFAVERATKIIVPSEATANDLVKYYKCPREKIEVVHHGFDPPNFSEKRLENVFLNSVVFRYFGITKTMHYIFFVGRLESKKNLERLIEAFKDFSEIRPEYKLILAGKRGVGFERILRKINQLKIADRIMMPGYITEEEKFLLYKHCRIFAFPSLYEGFGLPVLEAFYHEKPVLTSRISCLPEVAGEGAFYCDPYDKKSIFIGLEKLANDEDYKNELIKKGNIQLNKFSWQVAAEKTLKILKDG